MNSFANYRDWYPSLMINFYAGQEKQFTLTFLRTSDTNDKVKYN